MCLRWGSNTTWLCFNAGAGTLSWPILARCKIPEQVLPRRASLNLYRCYQWHSNRRYLLTLFLAVDKSGHFLPVHFLLLKSFFLSFFLFLQSNVRQFRTVAAAWRNLRGLDEYSAAIGDYYTNDSFRPSRVENTSPGIIFLYLEIIIKSSKPTVLSCKKLCGLKRPKKRPGMAHNL